MIKSIDTLVVDWDRLKMKEPKGRGTTYNERRFFVIDQHTILTQLSVAGCVQIPGETLPIFEMLTVRARLLLDWV